MCCYRSRLVFSYCDSVSYRKSQRGQLWLRYDSRISTGPWMRMPPWLHTSPNPQKVATQLCAKSVLYGDLLFSCTAGAEISLWRTSTCIANISSRQRLRWSSKSSLIVFSSRQSTVGDRTFPVAASRILNCLPPHVTSAPSLQTLRRGWSRCCSGAVSRPNSLFPITCFPITSLFSSYQPSGLTRHSWRWQRKIV